MKAEVNKEISFKFTIDEKENESIKDAIKFIMEVAEQLDFNDCEVLFDEEGDTLCELHKLNAMAETLDTMRILFYQHYELKAE